MFNKLCLLKALCNWVHVCGCWVQSIWRRLGACMRNLGACMRKRLGAKYAVVGCKVYGDAWVHVYAFWVHVYAFWVHVYGSVGCMYAVVGCMYAVASLRLRLGACLTVGSLPDSR